MLWYRPVHGLALSLCVSIAVAALLESEARPLSAAGSRTRNAEKAQFRPTRTFSPGPNVETVVKSSTPDSERLLFGLLSPPSPSPSPSPSPPPSLSGTEVTDADSPDMEAVAEPKDALSITNLFNTMKLFSSLSLSIQGISLFGLRLHFLQNLPNAVDDRVTKRGVGGYVREFGDEGDYFSMLFRGEVQACAVRPSLTLDRVQEMARKSFGIPDFEITLPPCTGGGKNVSCDYDGGSCCQRPQTEFVGRYYDTAVAAMALGATRDEAFSVLLHARALAYALEACDPSLSYRGNIPENAIAYQEKEATLSLFSAPTTKTSHWNPQDTSLISFPVAYEVLYENYNTMLIERMRSRRTTKFPAHALMQKLYSVLYYKRLMARVAPLNLELNPDIVLPTASDFTAAGLWSYSMQWSSRTGLDPSSESGADAASPEPIAISELHPSLRFSDDRITLFETESSSWKTVDHPKCNGYTGSAEYYPFKFQERVWSEMEGCCATECKFMALYGKTFDVHSSNCCAGCNRYRCTVNDVELAEDFATASIVEAGAKYNSGPEQIALVV